MFKCCECGCIFEEPKSWQESRGEFWGIPCSETMYGCPNCEGDFEEVDADDNDDEELDW